MSIFSLTAPKRGHNRVTGTAADKMNRASRVILRQNLRSVHFFRVFTPRVFVGHATRIFS